MVVCTQRRIPSTRRMSGIIFFFGEFYMLDDDSVSYSLNFGTRERSVSGSVSAEIYSKGENFGGIWVTTTYDKTWKMDLVGGKHGLWMLKSNDYFFCWENESKSS